MTAEISILNKHGIVLAADSAVTVSFGQGQAKTYNAVNKLFSLGETHDIGVMIYGNAEYMDIPWEIIIKEFRKRHQNTTFLTLKDCAETFINFLKEPIYTNEQITERMIASVIQSVLQRILAISSDRLNELQASLQDNNQEAQLSDTQIFEMLYKIIIENSDNSRDKILLHDFDKEQFYSKYQYFCKSIIDETVYLPSELLEKLYLPFLELSYQTIISKNVIDSVSGLVIAGYGNSELFPSLIAYEISYAVGDEIKMDMTNEKAIDLVKSDVAILPFAQSDMISTVLTGMDPLMSEVVSRSIFNLENLKDEEKDEIISSIAANQQKHFIDPILEVVRTLALPELANMAETLVNLTSFKRHISDSLETVGGPVDVLVISKGDGPIWINRKEYFDISKNIEYYNRKRR